MTTQKSCLSGSRAGDSHGADHPAGDSAVAPGPVYLAGVTKLYRRKVVLDQVDLTIPVGSVVGLLGKNGAGKTTLLQCALGLIRPESGHALLLGEPAWTLSASAKARLGYVPQEISLYGWMRAREVVDYTRSFYSRWNDSLVNRLLHDWEIDPTDRVSRMSVGTRQKLAIVLALGHEPDLLVLDEPAASLDPAARREFLKTVLAVTADGNRTVLFSTHITSDLERVADRVAILGAGKILFDGEIDALKDSVKRLHISAPHPLPQNFTVPGALAVRISGFEAMVSVRGSSAESIEEIRRTHGATVRVEDLNLEDIFLEMQHDLAG